MGQKPKINLGLTAFEDMFKDANERAEQKLPRIYDIPIDLVDDFPDHPFKVRQDEDMDLLVNSIRELGLITPVTLRRKEDGRYEMVSGHRRKAACIKLGLDTIKADIRDLTRDEAIILMVESNLQRTVILPSEKAFSYKMRNDAIKRQAGRLAKNGDPVGPHLRTSQIIAKDTDESSTQVKRYIRLTELIPGLLELVDEDKMALRPAVELSYLTHEEQQAVYEQILYRECVPSHAQAIRMRKLSAQGVLRDSDIRTIMREEKPNQVEKIHIPYCEIRQYIPKSVSYEDTGEYIKLTLRYYQETHPD